MCYNETQRIDRGISVVADRGIAVIADGSVVRLDEKLPYGAHRSMQSHPTWHIDFF